MRILGISAFYHDAAAALLDNGKIVAAAQEERFTRKKQDAGFPINAIRYCLEAASCGLDEIDIIAFYEQPRVKLNRLLQTHLAFAPAGFAAFRRMASAWIGGKINHRKLIANELGDLAEGVDISARLFFSDHHLSHAASAYYPSPFENAAILTIDGVGEWATTTTALGNGNDLAIVKEIRFPHSLGLLYAAFTAHIGFKVNSGEYKLMGLAPYGEPRYADRIRDNLIDVKPDGSFKLDLRYFDYCAGLRMTNERFADLFDGPARRPETEITQRHMDLAASIQQVTEEIVVGLAQGIRAETGAGHLCMAGGVALNCVANGKLLRKGIFDDIWIQPAAGDAGGALGAAYVAHHAACGDARRLRTGVDEMQGAYLGPEFSQRQIQESLDAMGARYDVLSDEELISKTVDALDKGLAVGWFQGRMEFGPRALGNRSILADPRNETIQSTLNLRVKYRESFRPFAPSVLAAESEDWFSLRRPSPYMLVVADVAEKRRLNRSETAKQSGFARLGVRRSQIPAVTHIDYSARVHTVDRQTNPRYHSLLSAFLAHTGCPVLVNTSFNVRGEPIVCSPQDAFRCFMGTEIERLAIGNCYLAKEDQDPKLKTEYRGRFELD